MNNFSSYYDNLADYVRDYFKILYKDIPLEVKPYVDVIIRLKDIDYFCGMKYASNYFYDFKYEFSRLDHSINCFLMALKLTNDFTIALSSLYHDCKTPIFSHVVDYLYKDYETQEVSESMNDLFLLYNNDLNKLLDKDNISVYDVINPKQYSIVDNDRPKLCIDRLDGIFLSSLSWTKTIDFDTIRQIYNNISCVLNENLESEICLGCYCDASNIKLLEQKINKACHSDEDKFAMSCMANIINYSLDKKYIFENELYELTEEEFLDIINKNRCDDSNLDNLMNIFTNTNHLEEIPKVKCKIRYINPLYKNGNEVCRLK